ncbi:ABC transporter ATP-binding protein [Chitinilyticum litopenaei]|uniref:ABC transporter ATP-binding protein n=1 Tax=Chitinilyticum litopenaei TaxID=1121276 RepID=UPI00041634C5|nr:ABC transporter ATP-binding protein [Chitinilyticum litopenaei]
MSLMLNDVRVARGKAHIIAGLSLPPLPPGSMTALIGPNGAGKSTLIHALAGLLPARGSIRLHGQALETQPAAERSRRVGLLPQTLPQAVGLTVYELLLGGLLTLGLARDEAEQRIERVLGELRLAGLALRALATLSGGQRQLVALAQLLASEPELLLLDEPNSALDLHWQLAMIEAIRADVARRGAIAVLALHDINLALRSCERVIVLHRGACVADGAPQTVLDPALLAQVYGVAARIETCSQGQPVFILDRLIRPDEV